MEELESLDSVGMSKLDFPRRYNTIGHLILDLETELGATASDYSTLDDIIDEAKERIVAKEKYSREEAIKVMRTIGEILNKKFPKYYQDGNFLFHQGFKSGIRDCATSTLIYLSIAEEMQLPLVAVPAPRHMFVRWTEDDVQFNWETSTLRAKRDEEYITDYNISEKSIENNVFMMNLTREESIAYSGYDRRVYIWLENGYFEKAIEISNEAIKIFPNIINGYFLRGLALARSDDIDKSIEDFTKVIELDPNHFSAYHNRGIALNLKGENSRALEDFGMAIELDTANKLDSDPSLSYFMRGFIFVKEGRNDEALEDFDKAITLNPNYQQTYLYRGQIFMNNGDQDRAIRDFNKGIELDPNDARVYFQRGNSFFHRGNPTRAIKDYNRAIRLEPNNPDFYNIRGLAWQQKGNIAEANADFEKVKTLQMNL